MTMMTVATWLQVAFATRTAAQDAAANRVEAETRPLQPSTFLDTGNSPLQKAHVFGDWGGSRTALENLGISPYAQFLTESAGNPEGGAQRAAAYAHQLLLGLDLDWNQIANIQGLQTHFVVVNREGSNVSGKISNLFNVQEIYGGGDHGVRLVYFNFEKTLAEGRVNILAGRMTAGTDFATSDLYCTFQNLGLCPSPESLFLNGGYEIFPYSSWGARLRVRTVSAVYIQAGAFEVNPTLISKSGWDWSTAGSTGVLLPVEAGWTPGQGQNDLPGHYKIGAIFDTGPYPDLLYTPKGQPYASSGEPAMQHHGRQQAYMLFDQMLHRDLAGDTGGLVALGGFVWAQEDRSRISRFGFAGVSWTGAIHARPNDGVSLLALYGKVSPRLAQTEAIEIASAKPLPYNAPGVQSSEIDLEVDYTAVLRPGLVVMPNVQYIVRPGASSANSNALVFGLRTQVSF